MSEPKYPADLPVSQALALDAQERIAIALERIADALEIKASPVAEFPASTVASRRERR